MIDVPRSIGSQTACRPPLRGRAGEAIALLAAPVIVFLVWHVRAMPRTLMIDPFFYGAYAQNGPDLLRRFGTGNYFWPRVGFILPDRVFVTLFGPLAGFFTFRFVLALVASVPVYIMFRQVRGRWAGWIAVLVILTAPVVLAAWGTDYPDSSAISYLMAGGACLFIQPRLPRSRVLLLFAAGLFLGSAVNSQIVAALSVFALLAGRAVSCRDDGPRRLMRDFATVLAGAVAVTAILVVWSQLVLGHWDIFRPTLHAVLQLNNPADNGAFHSSTWRWLIDDIYVLVPPAVVAAWVVVSWPVFGRSDVSRAELGFAVATAVAFAIYTFEQVARQSWTLEYYLWTSMLWSMVCPLFAFTVIRVATGPRRGAARRSELALVTICVVAFPLLLRLFRDQLQLDLRVAFAVALVPAIGALLSRFGRHAMPRAVGVASVVLALTLLVVGLPANPTIFPGQLAYVPPDYGTELFGNGQADVDQYSIFASLPSVVPTSDALPGPLATWEPPAHSNVLTVATAQYLYTIGGLPQNMPTLDRTTYQLLIGRRPTVLVLLSDDGTQFDAAERALSDRGFAPRLVRQAILRSGADVLWVRVLQLTAQPT